MLHTSSPRSRRQGVILLVVVSMLTLFAIVGLSFVMYAESEAKGSLYQREAQSEFRPDVDPDMLAAFALGQLIYDVPDDETGVYSAMRGHSLARSMYGQNDMLRWYDPTRPAEPNESVGAANLHAFNGVGRLRGYTHTQPPLAGQNDYNFINYTYYATDNFVRDPERLGMRANLNAPRGPFAGGFNVPYTYPDLNNMFLAAVKADGTVLLPSFHRPWTGIGALDPFNTAWTLDPQGLVKYQTLRPHRAYHGQAFPLPEIGGDVKQLVGTPGPNDSIWLDLGFPVRVSPEGIKYKPLFAFLVTDLDNRINLNVVGNIRGEGPNNTRQHRSNMGWGPWEVNIGKVLSAPDANLPIKAEWTNLFVGDSTRTWLGRYGLGPLVQPSANATVDAGRMAHFYGQADFDGSKSTSPFAPTDRFLFPGQPPAPPQSPFPYFVDPSGWDNGVNKPQYSERRDHPLLYDVMQPQGDDRRFALSNMEALLRYQDTGSPALTSELFQLCPTNFSDPTLGHRRRGLVTVRSFDVDTPGVVPWIYNLNNLTALNSPPIVNPDDPASADNPPAPVGTNFAFPDPTTARQPLFDASNNNGEFGGVDWRALTAALGRVDLNRPLAPYPHQGSGQRPPFGQPLTRDPQNAALMAPHNAFVANPADPQIVQQLNWAQEDRQRLARDIYRVLLAITGVSPPTPGRLTDEELRPRRWLAQLTVNIVDFLDEDEISLPFCFYGLDEQGKRIMNGGAPLVDINERSGTSAEDDDVQFPRYWVFGTELPRLVLNEVMAQTFDARPGYDSNNLAIPIRVFVELHNPFPARISTTVQQPDSFPVPLRIQPANMNAYSPYQVVVASRQQAPPGASAISPGIHNDNVLGSPSLDPAQLAIRCKTAVTDFAAPATMIRGNPANQPNWPGLPGQYGGLASPYVPASNVGNVADPQGAILLGPLPETGGQQSLADRDPFDSTGNPPNSRAIPDNTPVIRTNSLRYTRPFAPNAQDDERTAGLVVMLRRLANPHLPLDIRRALPNGEANPHYNPYITIDYLDRVQLRGTEHDRPLASVGRRQPYAAHRTQRSDQSSPPPAPPQDLRYTFGRPNATEPPSPDPYDWLVHHDRQLVSPFELLHVSGYQPYQLTQRFMMPNARFGHRVPWFDEGRAATESHRLFRAFEFLQTGSRAAGVVAGGRVPGRININTVWDPETILALVDEQQSNFFHNPAQPDAFAAQIFQSLVSSRTPNAQLGVQDRPFWGLGLGKYMAADAQFATASGLTDSILRLQVNSGPLQTAGAHPYQWFEALNKIANKITTRSNVFAVYLTVGFFEVAPNGENFRPVKLGAEIGKAANRHVRHRMFAIVDRTCLSVATAVTELSQNVIVNPVQPPQQPPPTMVPLSSRRGVTPSGFDWNITGGSTIIVGVGENQEVVVVRSDGRAVFRKSHPAGTPVSLPNVPGEAPYFLKTSSVETNPLNVTQAWVSVPALTGTNQDVSGECDGVAWQIRPGTPLLLGTGAAQEYVRVQAVQFVPPGPNNPTPLARLQLNLSNPQPFPPKRLPGEPFAISNTLLGNPGPQPQFSPRQAPYSAVVRYLSIIQ